METSLSTHLFAFHDIDDYIASLFARFGFPCAELWAMPPHFPYRDPEAADRIAAVLSRRAVRTASLHAPLYPDVRTYRKDRWFSLSSDDEEHRLESVAATAAAGAWLARNGGGTLVVHTGFPAADWFPRRWGAFLSSMNELLDRVPPDTRLAVENTPLPSGRVEVILDIVARYPPDRVGVCLDLGHANIQGAILPAIGAAAPRLIHVHASDNDGERDDHLVPGRGSIPWGPVFDALRDAGFPGPLTVELRDSVRGENPRYRSFEELLAECRAALDLYLDGRR
ncbi:MAG: sugar phosphate isomerase/epimerase family protein [Gemmatimonadota bacterium]